MATIIEITTNNVKRETMTERIITSLLESTKMMMEMMETTKMIIIKEVISKTTEIKTTGRMIILEPIKMI